MKKHFSSETKEMAAILREAAGKEILPRWGKAKALEKSKHANFKDIVTQADIKASKFILGKVRGRFPGSYSEEHKYEDRFGQGLVWEIDPLDGTEEFCRKIKGGYSCNAALLERRAGGRYKPVAGIIYLPGVGKLWHFDGKEVAFIKKGKKVQIPKPRRDRCSGWVRKVDPDRGLVGAYRSLSQKLGLPVEIRHGGGAGASFSDLLEGKINLIIMNYNYSKEWDVAMAEPLVRALGGFICDLDGKEFRYNRKDAPGLGEPYNLNGYVASIAFRKEEIIPNLPKKLLVNRL